jgi:hypothetical protein
MTEAEWLACTDPWPMLDPDAFGGRSRDRKLRLFACACVRRVWDFLDDPRSRMAVEVAERFADGGATWTELGVAFHAAWTAGRRFAGHTGVAEAAALECAYHDSFAAARNASLAAAEAAAWSAHRDAAGAAGVYDALADALAAAQADQCALLRELVGNPFRPVNLSEVVLGWNDATVPRLAGMIYAGPHWDDLPVLADALEEAGCSDAAVLAHCRGGGEHVRGCWVIDLLLAKGSDGPAAPPPSDWPPLMLRARR